VQGQVSGELMYKYSRTIVCKTLVLVNESSTCCG